VRTGLASQDLIDSLANVALEPRFATPDQFAALVRQDYERWGPIAKATGFMAVD
jgi:tripartite-type tricarboxylate transporter receptor subunit TctC